MDYKHVLTVQLKDGVVTPESMVWVHWTDVPPEYEKAEYHWRDIVEAGDWFSIEKPEYTISEDGETIYKE